MLPIVLDTVVAPILLVIGGGAGLRRLELMDQAAARSVRVYAAEMEQEIRQRAGARYAGVTPDHEALAWASFVFVAGVEQEQAAAIARDARQSGALVNVEDVKPLCDFHVPSLVRRGDLIFSVSTAGKAPGLARRLRQHLEGLFGPEWANRIADVADRRNRWRAEGVPLSEVGRRVSAYVDKKGWLG